MYRQFSGGCLPNLDEAPEERAVSAQGETVTQLGSESIHRVCSVFQCIDMSSLADALRAPLLQAPSHGWTGARTCVVPA